MADPNCGRCGASTPTTDNERETTFWGAVETETSTTVIRTARIRATYFRQRRELVGSPVLRVDERVPLCDDCWSLLVRCFLKGRPVPARATQ